MLANFWLTLLARNEIRFFGIFKHCGFEKKKIQGNAALTLPQVLLS